MSKTTSLPAIIRGGFVAVLLIAGIAVSLLAGDPFTTLFFVSYAIAGGLLVMVRPRNVIGWLLMAIGCALGLASLYVHASPESLRLRTASLGDELVAWGSGWGWTAGFGLLLALSIVFPDGRLPVGRWRTPAVVLICAAALTAGLTAFAPMISVTLAGGEADAAVPNPFALFPRLAAWDLFPYDALILIVVGQLVIGVVSMIVRYRRSTGLERVQLRWFVAALAFVMVALAVGLATFPFLGGFAWLPVAFAYPTVPAAITVAVLRYRLYDIDLLINRAALYGAVTLILAALFGLANVATQRLLQPLTGEHSDVVTAGLAVAAAVGFGPMSRRLRPIADRVLPARALLTLFFTDIVESTRRAVELGDEGWRDLLQRYRLVVRRDLGRFGGHEVDTAGDGFFATFERPIAAVQSAVDVRADVRRLGLELRIGLHRGECQMRGEKVTGIAVHAAARVMSVARGGEILVSDAVRESIADLDVSTTDRGLHELKGVPGEWQLYAIGTASETGPDPARLANMTDTDAHEPKRDRSGALEGADRAALGVSPPPNPAPPGASVDPTEELVPGATKGDRVPAESKPWFTSLAADSEHGVSDEPDDPDQ